MATDVLAVVRAPISWAKAKPVAFIILIFAVGIIAIKLAVPFLQAVGKIPIVGGRVVAFATPQAA